MYIYTLLTRTTTLHVQSGLIHIATPTSLRSTLDAFIVLHPLPLCHPNCQTAQVWLATHQHWSNSHNHRLTSYTLLQCLLFSAAASAQPIGTPHGNSAHHFGGGSYIEAHVRGRLVQLDHSRVFPCPLDGQLEPLKRVEEDQAVKQVI